MESRLLILKKNSTFHAHFPTIMDFHPPPSTPLQLYFQNIPPFPFIPTSSFINSGTFATLHVYSSLLEIFYVLKNHKEFLSEKTYCSEIGIIHLCLCLMFWSYMLLFLDLLIPFRSVVVSTFAYSWSWSEGSRVRVELVQLRDYGKVSSINTSRSC
mgnify:CR=1 FL=1